MSATYMETCKGGRGAVILRDADVRLVVRWHSGIGLRNCDRLDAMKSDG